MSRFNTIIILLIIGSISLFGKVPTVQKQRLNDGWLFLRGDIGNIWEAVRPASDGSPETVPLWTPAAPE